MFVEFLYGCELFIFLLLMVIILKYKWSQRKPIYCQMFTQSGYHVHNVIIGSSYGGEFCKLIPKLLQLPVTSSPLRPVSSEGSKLLFMEDCMQKGGSGRSPLTNFGGLETVSLSLVINFSRTCCDLKTHWSWVRKIEQYWAYIWKKIKHLPCSSAFRGSQKRMMEWIKALMQWPQKT